MTEPNFALAIAGAAIFAGMIITPVFGYAAQKDTLSSAISRLVLGVLGISFFW